MPATYLYSPYKRVYGSTPGIRTHLFLLPPSAQNNSSKSTLWLYFQIFHFGTAQQVGNKIEFSAVCLDTNFDMTFDSEIWLSNTSVSPGLAYSFTIDLTSKRCSRTQIDRASVEFPSTHPYRHGIRGTRYNYFMACDRPGFNLPYRDVVKVRQRVVASASHGHSCPIRAFPFGNPLFFSFFFPLF